MSETPPEDTGFAELRSRLVAVAGVDVGRSFDRSIAAEPSPADRRRRQQRELAVLIRNGDVDRALVLCREHLAEFPDDEVVAGLERLLGEATP